MNKSLAKSGLVLSTLIYSLAPILADAAETTTYEYDALGRLKKVDKSGGPKSGTQTTTSYDPAGNRTNQTTAVPSPPPPSPPPPP